MFVDRLLILPQNNSLYPSDTVTIVPPKYDLRQFLCTGDSLKAPKSYIS